MPRTVRNFPENRLTLIGKTKLLMLSELLFKNNDSIVIQRHTSRRSILVKKRLDFQAFLDDVVAEAPINQEIHVILDNYATHKKNDDWLASHPNVHFHFTPTSAGWLNQVEIWFGIFTRKTLAGASFQSTEQLTQAIEAFVNHYNKTAAPFIWRKREVRGAQLRNTIINLCN